MIAVARQHKWSKTEVSKRSTIPQVTLWQWFDGTYGGAVTNVSDRVEKWLDATDEMTLAAARVPMAPGFVVTPTAARLTDMLLYAQMMPAMVLGTLAPGMGKTKTAEQYEATHPAVLKVTMRPTTSSVQRMLLTIAEALDVNENNPGDRERGIGKKLKRNGKHTLLIVDEAQHLVDQAVNQLRYLHDEFGVGIALLGNEELYGRFGDSTPKPAYAQLHSRIGMRMKQLQPAAGDVEALVEAWGIADPEVVKLARALGRKPGALRQVSETLKLAGMYAAGEGREIGPKDLHVAIKNRGVED